MLQRNETHYEAHRLLANIYQTLGRPREAAEVLGRAIWMNPFEIDMHQQLAELRADVGDANGEVVERRAVLALNPVDRAEAHYRLAIAHERAGDAARARRQVLMSLEIAPGYPDAQELLLRLVQGTAASASTGEGS